MNNNIENIITYANILAVTREIVKSIGFEFQAPIDDAELTEVVSGQVMGCVNNAIREGKK